ncbi:DUF7507 domain-containing protein [Falsiroseomonas sp. HW251]|uniref:DUF7507 domain-containing protein n=1 Tax=Falsiroseomonas sp. HW251 TaxID=3390998 RepID=UPI003D319DE1
MSQNLTSGGTATINGAVFVAEFDSGTGSGVLQPFVRIQESGTENGANNDPALGQFEDVKPAFLSLVTVNSLAALPATPDIPFESYAFVLDIGEPGGKASLITLETLKVFVSSKATLYYSNGDWHDAALGGSVVSLTPIYDLDAGLGGNTSVLLDGDLVGSGNGKTDLGVFIPTSLFTGGQYVYLYSEFSGTDGSFEEWAGIWADTIPTPRISIVKNTADAQGLNGDDGLTILAGSSISFVYTVRNTGDVALSGVTVTDDNGTPGNTADDNTASYVSGDTNGNSLLDLDETWIFSLAGTAIHGNYANNATVVGSGAGSTVSSTDDSSYVGVTPGIAVDKVTGDGPGGLDNDGDNLTILAGKAVIWTYSVTNIGDVPLSGVVVKDDNGTADTGDDKIASYLSGDTNGDSLLGTTETWIYTLAGTTGSDDYTNLGTASGTYTDDLRNGATVSGSDGSGYTVAKPSVDIEKYVVINGVAYDADTAPGQLVSQYDTIQFRFVVHNTGNVALTDLVVTDDRFDLNGSLPGGAWTIASLDADDSIAGGADEATLTIGASFQAGQHTNTGSVVGCYTDDLGNTAAPTDSDAANYFGVPGPGVRTPGFWSNWTDFWDGDSHKPAQAGTKGFAPWDVVYNAYLGDNGGSGSVKDPVGIDVYSAPVAAGNTANGNRGILIGDYDLNGKTDAGESTIFYSLTEALTIINASAKVQGDARYILDRHLVATWLNYMAGNPLDAPDATKTDARDLVDWSVAWLKARTPDENGDGAGDGNLVLDAATWKTASSSNAWVKGIDGGDGGSGITNYTAAGLHGFDPAKDIPAGSLLSGLLDEYNNNGTVNGVFVAWNDALFT